MDLTSEFCDNFENELLANIDPADIKGAVKWYNHNEQRLQRSNNNPFVLVGRLAGLDEGSKFGVQGDRIGVGGRAFKPIGDNDIVHDVFQLKPFFSTDPVHFQKMWDRQYVNLKKLESRDGYNSRSYVLNEIPREVVSSISAEDGTEANDAESARINVYWNKYEEPKHGNITVSVRDRRKVVQNAFYEPSFMPNYDPLFFNFDKYKLVQHDVFDEFDHLVAPWDFGSELRANSVVAIIASFDPIKVRIHPGSLRSGFKKIHEIRGWCARVLLRGDGRPRDQSPPFVPPEYKKRIANKSLMDFPGFDRKTAT